ncbi:HK97 gp10 family phage protein [Rhodococcus zopfii]
MAVRVTVYSDRARSEARAISFDGRVDIARDIAADARSSAPVYTGAYRDGISVSTSGDRVFVVDSDPDAIYKEYGTVDTPAHAALTDAARKHGEYRGWQPRGG